MKPKTESHSSKWLKRLHLLAGLLALAAIIRPFIRLAWEVGTYLQQNKQLRTAQLQKDSKVSSTVSEIASS